MKRIEGEGEVIGGRIECVAGRGDQGSTRTFPASPPASITHFSSLQRQSVQPTQTPSRPTAPATASLTRSRTSIASCQGRPTSLLGPIGFVRLSRPAIKRRQNNPKRPQLISSSSQRNSRTGLIHHSSFSFRLCYAVVPLLSAVPTLSWFRYAIYHLATTLPRYHTQAA